MSSQLSLIKWFYWLTPLFFLLDFAFGWDMRVAGLEQTDHKILYYLFIAAIALIQWWKPSLEAVTALVDCAINYAILIIATYTKYLGILVGAADGEVASPITVQEVLNFVLVGSMMIISFRKAALRLHERHR